jgi:hypothetical protein
VARATKQPLAEEIITVLSTRRGLAKSASRWLPTRSVTLTYILWMEVILRVSFRVFLDTRLDVSLNLLEKELQVSRLATTWFLATRLSAVRHNASFVSLQRPICVPRFVRHKVRESCPTAQFVFITRMETISTTLWGVRPWVNTL